MAPGKWDITWLGISLKPDIPSPSPPLPVGAIVEQKLIDAEAAGLGDKHVDAMILRLEELTGVQVRSKQQ